MASICGRGRAWARRGQGLGGTEGDTEDGEGCPGYLGREDRDKIRK